MKNEPIELLTQPKWRIIDQSSLGLYVDPKQSFAMDDTLCASVGEGPFTSDSPFLGASQYDCAWDSGYKTSISPRWRKAA